jgi:gluconolactonase
METPFEVLDPRFGKLRPPVAKLEVIHTGCRFTEGAVYFGDHRCLLFSDVPSSRMYRWDEETGQVTTFRANSNFSNGNTRDREGRLVTCEHGARRVTRTELDGSITILMDNFGGKKLNAPNDVVVASDGSIWFTDPGYGILNDHEGNKSESEVPVAVYRIDPATGKGGVVADDFVRPNGLAFSPDEKTLYIVDSGITHGGPAHIRVFDVDGPLLRNDKVFADDFAPGLTDGIRLDTEGNVWASVGWGDPAEDGVRCYLPSGDLIGKIHLPETVANLCFGGAKRNRLFIAASTSIYTVYVDAKGAQRP